MHGRTAFAYSVTIQRPFMRLHDLFAFISMVLLTSACSVITVADAAVSVGATAVKAGASVVGAAVDVTSAGVKAVTGNDEKK